MTDDQMDARLHAAGETWRATAGPATSAPALSDSTAVETLDTRGPHRPRRWGLLASAAVVAAALVTGGAFLIGNGSGKHDQGADAATLEGTVWRLVGSGDRPAQTTSLSTMYIDKDGNVVADDSCTVVGAHLDVRDGHLYPIGNFDIRYRDCTDSVGEITFGNGFELLTHVPSYELTGDGLTLSAAGQPSLYFIAAPGLLPPTLDVPTFLGSTWRLTHMTDGKQVDHLVAGNPTLQVRNGRLTASDGCNTISAAAAVEGQQVALKNITSTRNPCAPESAASAIDAFFTTDGLHEQIDGTALTIKGGGVGVLTYAWQPADAKATDPAALTNRPWILTSIAGAPARALASLFVDSRGPVSGTDGCTGVLDATATVGPGTITFTGVPTEPAAGCTNADPATTIDSLLNQKPALWAVRDGKLLIYGGGPQAFALVYETGQPAPTYPSATPNPATLLGPTWTLIALETDSNGSSSGEGSSGPSITLRFAGGATFALRTACGGLEGKAAVKGTRVDFSSVKTTGGNYCLDSSAQRVERVFAGTVEWKIDNDGLHLTKGNTTLTFSP